jgi:SAM-dependent methyltransferase
MSSLSRSPEFQLSSVAFFGRTLGEYLRFFGLSAGDLAERRTLDVAAGPSSFTAEACLRGMKTVAVDPLYGYSAASLAAFVQVDYARVLAELRAKQSLLRYGYFPSIEASEASRRGAADRFLADYEAGFAQGRYVGGALPRLPFADGAFDLVLCAHLLFTYARHFDYAWHLAACVELSRVSSTQVRLHPVCGPDGKAYPELDRLREDLSRAGIASRVIPVDYEFFAGTDATLVLSRGG